MRLSISHREGNTVSTLLYLDLCVRRVLAYCLGTYIGGRWFQFNSRICEVHISRWEATEENEAETLMTAIATSLNMRQLENSRDGNCLFQSISYLV